MSVVGELNVLYVRPEFNPPQALGCVVQPGIDDATCISSGKQRVYCDKCDQSDGLGEQCPPHHPVVFMAGGQEGK